MMMFMFITYSTKERFFIVVKYLGKKAVTQSLMTTTVKYNFFFKICQFYAVKIRVSQYL